MKNLTKNAVISSLFIFAAVALVANSAFAATRTTTSTTTAPVSESTAPVLTSVCGDANNDGSPTIADYIEVRDYASGLKSTLTNMAQADINKNGTVKSEDADLLYAYLFLGGTCPGQLTSVCGDVDNNGQPDIVDRGILNNNLTGAENSFVINKAQADINQDGSLTKDDLTLLENYIWRGGTCPAQMPVFVAPVLTSVCGDANNDGSPNVSDFMVLMDHLYEGQPAPVNATQADINCDGTLDVLDQILLYKYVFQGGTCPVMPDQPLASNDSAYDRVSCVDYNSDHMIDQLDIDKVVDAAWRGAPYEERLDWDKNNYIDMVDVVSIVNFVNRNGLAPVCEAKEHVSCFDVDNDQDTDFNDLRLLIGIAHEGQPMPKNADNTDNFSIVDVHMDGVIDLLDVVDGINYLHRDGAKPECIPPQGAPYIPPVPPQGDPVNGT